MTRFARSAVRAKGSLQPPHLGGAIQKYGALLGAVGVSGDTSDNDEICAMSV
jgi:uncharacterized protein GlcG (DUF336 family)